MNMRANMGMKNIKLSAGILLSLLISVPAFSLKLPSIFFFPLSPGFGFGLVSENGSSISGSLTHIELGQAQDASTFYVNWKVKLNFDGRETDLYLRLLGDTNGDLSLSEMRQGAYTRSIYDDPLVFPASVNFGSNITLGEDIGFKYVRTLNQLTIKERNKTLTDLIAADLVIGTFTNTLYFARGMGLVAVKTPRTTFYTTNN